MRLCNTMPARLLANNKRKLYNALNTNNLGGGIAQSLIHKIYFDVAQHKYFDVAQHKYFDFARYQKLRIIVSDVTRGHLLCVSLCLSSKCQTMEGDILYSN